MTTPAPYKRSTTTATLYTLVSNLATPGVAGNLGAEEDGQLRINFPAMPDVVTLARTANYESIKTPATPDGFHWYRNTDPLTIPIKFSLAGFDRDYCRDDGPFALLDTAAKLHAMTMPIIPATPVSTRAAGAAPDGVKGSEAGLAAGAAGGNANLANNQIQVSVDNTGLVKQAINANVTDLVYFPPACVLSIILAEIPGKPRLGIQCVGFVGSVDVSFHGPWLQSSSARGEAVINLPSRADFDFRFTHQPNYTNAYLGGGAQSLGNIYTTTAQTVRNRLYNQFAAGTPQSPSLAFADLFGRTGR